MFGVFDKWAETAHPVSGLAGSARRVGVACGRRRAADGANTGRRNPGDSESGAGERRDGGGRHLRTRIWAEPPAGPSV